MICVYGLAYRMVDVVRSSVTSILREAGEPIALTVVHNACDDARRDREIRDAMLRLIERGVRVRGVVGWLDVNLYRYVRLANNALDAGLYETWRRDRQWAALRYHAGLASLDGGEEFVVMTDLDLTVPATDDYGRQTAWASRTRAHLIQRSATRQRVYAACAYGLDMINYVPPNAGHDEFGTNAGLWLMAMRTDLLTTFPTDRVVLDVEICERARAAGGFAFVPGAQLYHHGWDVWRDDPAYWAQKVAGVPWGTWIEPEIVEVVGAPL
jgi:hypothetical protein